MPRAFVLLFTLVALVVAGCGGGDDGDSGSGSGDGQGTTKAQYTQQVRSAGAALQKSFADISDQTAADTTSANVAMALDTGVATLDQTVKKFKAITPPKDAEAAHQKFVDGFEELTGAFREAADAARKSDTAALNKALQGLAAGEGVKKITEAQKELKALGINFASQ
jgi:hypothetical protein